MRDLHLNVFILTVYLTATILRELCYTSQREAEKLALADRLRQQAELVRRQPLQFWPDHATKQRSQLDYDQQLKAQRPFVISFQPPGVPYGAAAGGTPFAHRPKREPRRTRLP